MRPNTPCWMRSWPGPMSTQPAADGSRQGATRRRLPSVHWSVARIESPWKGTEMRVPRNILRVVLLTAAAGLLAVAASVLREKKATVDLTTQQIEDAISALDPGVRAAVIGRLTADAVQQVKDHVDRCPDLGGWWADLGLTQRRRIGCLELVCVDPRARVVDERDPTLADNYCKWLIAA